MRQRLGASDFLLYELRRSGAHPLADQRGIDDTDQNQRQNLLAGRPEMKLLARYTAQAPISQRIGCKSYGPPMAIHRHRCFNSST